MNVADTWTAITDDAYISPNSAVSLRGSTMFTYHKTITINFYQLSFSYQRWPLYARLFVRLGYRRSHSARAVAVRTSSL